MKEKAKMLIKRITLIVIMLLICRQSGAELKNYDALITSIELLVDASEAIGVYTVEEINVEDEKKDSSVNQLKSNLTASFKGRAPSDIVFEHIIRVGESEPLTTIQKNDEFLVFLYQDGQKELYVRDSFHLNHPSVYVVRGSVAVTKTLEVLDTKEEIMKVVKERIELNRHVKEFQYSEKIFEGLKHYIGSDRHLEEYGRVFINAGICSHFRPNMILDSYSISCTVELPADQDLKEQFIKGLNCKEPKQPRQGKPESDIVRIVTTPFSTSSEKCNRVQAIENLSAYPGEKTENVLKPLLNDPYFNEFIGWDGEKLLHYPIKHATKKVLRFLEYQKTDL